MARKYPYIGFRPDKKAEAILELISEQGQEKTKFINEAIKYYHQNKELKTLEKVVDDLKVAIKEIKSGSIIKTEEQGRKEPEQTNDEFDLNEMILDIGNAFTSWGEAPKEVKKEEPFTKDDDDIFVDDDDIEI